jgi:hypothetical protein
MALQCRRWNSSTIRFRKRSKFLVYKQLLASQETICSTELHSCVRTQKYLRCFMFWES